MRHNWRTRGLYVWRGRKPHAPLGLPVIGRRVLYVGQTSSRYHRDRQHAHGDSRYDAGSASWSDLAPKVYPLPCLFPAWRRARLIQEWLWIKLTFPVYNVQHNRGNPRRISRERAAAQREARDKRRASNPLGNLVVDILLTCVRLIIGFAAMGLLAWMIWETR